MRAIGLLCTVKRLSLGIDKKDIRISRLTQNAKTGSHNGTVKFVLPVILYDTLLGQRHGMLDIAFQGILPI